MLYSVKMRSAQGGPHEQGGRHISGAERILSEEKIEQAIVAMLHRAQKHQRGMADFISLKVEAVKTADIFYRPFIKTPEEGASTAIYLALSKEMEGKSGCCFADRKEKKITARICPPALQTKLWNETERWFVKKNIRLD